jgi:hypothetical protein
LYGRHFRSKSLGSPEQYSTSVPPCHPKKISQATRMLPLTPQVCHSKRSRRTRTTAHPRTPAYRFALAFLVVIPQRSDGICCLPFLPSTTCPRISRPTDTLEGARLQPCQSIARVADASTLPKAGVKPQAQRLSCSPPQRHQPLSRRPRRTAGLTLKAWMFCTACTPSKRLSAPALDPSTTSA